MIFSAVLDTNVLYPFSLRDTLLRLAELELYTPLWSARILEEMTRNLTERQMTEDQAARIATAMRAAFEEADVDAGEIERLEPAMTNDPKDRHVLAAAVAADSELIITFNLDDFPPEACDPLGVEAIPRRLPPRSPRPRPRGRPRRPGAAGGRPPSTLAARQTPPRPHHRRRAPLRQGDPRRLKSSRRA